MSDNNDPINIFDPTGVFKEMRDTGMGAWAKMMVELVNTDAYAEANGQMLDAWLSTSGPFRQVLEKVMTQSLANLHLPSREEITRLAERLTNIEMRLDDMDAKLSEISRLGRNASKSKSKASSGEKDK